MKKIISIGLLLVVIFFSSCKNKSCNECTNCKTLANSKICEDDYTTPSDYTSAVANLVSDGCSCVNK